jgi:hypothetical protein
MQTRVDDVHPGVTQRAGYDPYAAIVTIQSYFGEEHTNGLRHLKTSLRTMAGTCNTQARKHPALAAIHEWVAIPDTLRGLLARERRRRSPTPSDVAVPALTAIAVLMGAFAPLTSGGRRPWAHVAFRSVMLDGSITWL